MKVFIVAIIVVIFQQNIKLADGVTCASNPCNLVAGAYDATTGYCCTDLPPYYTDSVCTCPNSIAPTINAPCRGNTVAAQAFCNRTCLNGGVCNIVNAQEVCYCTLGFSGTNCELQGLAGGCTTARCQAGYCVNETIGISTFSYCYCNPGWIGQSCELCYFTCSQAGVFPDTANCAIGRYFYCPQASGAPIVATCPAGQRFNRLTNNCDATYNCT